MWILTEYLILGDEFWFFGWDSVVVVLFGSLFLGRWVLKCLWMEFHMYDLFIAHLCLRFLGCVTLLDLVFSPWLQRPGPVHLCIPGAGWRCSVGAARFLKDGWCVRWAQCCQIVLEYQVFLEMNLSKREVDTWNKMSVILSYTNIKSRLH